MEGNRTGPAAGESEAEPQRARIIGHTRLSQISNKTETYLRPYALKLKRPPRRACSI